jgi:single-strand DNA-binding protein
MAYDSKGTLNKIMLIGRLGADPELKYTGSGTAVLNLSVATNTAYKQGDQKQEDTEWHRITAWRKLAEIIAQYASKGALVYVEGRLQTRSWEDQDGNKRYMTEVVADSIQLLGSKPQSNCGPVGDDYVPPEQPEPEGVEDDLPF